MQMHTSIEVLTADLLHTAQSAYQDLSKPYTTQYLNLMPTFQTHYGIIHRPNHALLHSLEVAAFMPKTIYFYINCASESYKIFFELYTPRQLKIMQIAATYSVVGREDETGFNTKYNNPSLPQGIEAQRYKQFRKKSADKFVAYCTANQDPAHPLHQTPLTPAEIAHYHNVVLVMGDPAELKKANEAMQQSLESMDDGYHIVLLPVSTSKIQLEQHVQQDMYPAKTIFIHDYPDAKPVYVLENGMLTTKGRHHFDDTLIQPLHNTNQHGQPLLSSETASKLTTKMRVIFGDLRGKIAYLPLHNPMDYHLLNITHNLHLFRCYRQPLMHGIITGPLMKQFCLGYKGTDHSIDANTQQELNVFLTDVSKSIQMMGNGMCSQFRGTQVTADICYRNEYNFYYANHNADFAFKLINNVHATLQRPHDLKILATLPEKLLPVQSLWATVQQQFNTLGANQYYKKLQYVFQNITMLPASLFSTEIKRLAETQKILDKINRKLQELSQNITQLEQHILQMSQAKIVNCNLHVMMQNITANEKEIEKLLREISAIQAEMPQRHSDFTFLSTAIEKQQQIKLKYDSALTMIGEKSPENDQTAGIQLLLRLVTSEKYIPAMIALGEYYYKQSQLLFSSAENLKLSLDFLIMAMDAGDKLERKDTSAIKHLALIPVKNLETYYASLKADRSADKLLNIKFQLFLAHYLGLHGVAEHPENRNKAEHDYFTSRASIIAPRLAIPELSAKLIVELQTRVAQLLSTAQERRDLGQIQQLFSLCLFAVKHNAIPNLDHSTVARMQTSMQSCDLENSLNPANPIEACLQELSRVLGVAPPTLAQPTALSLAALGASTTIAPVTYPNTSATTTSVTTSSNAPVNLFPLQPVSVPSPPPPPPPPPPLPQQPQQPQQPTKLQ